MFSTGNFCGSHIYSAILHTFSPPIVYSHSYLLQLPLPYPYYYYICLQIFSPSNFCITLFVMSVVLHTKHNTILTGFINVCCFQCHRFFLICWFAEICLFLCICSWPIIYTLWRNKQNLTKEGFVSAGCEYINLSNRMIDCSQMRMNVSHYVNDGLRWRFSQMVLLIQSNIRYKDTNNHILFSSWRWYCIIEFCKEIQLRNLGRTSMAYCYFHYICIDSSPRFDKSGFLWFLKILDQCSSGVDLAS